MIRRRPAGREPRRRRKLPRAAGGPFSHTCANQGASQAGGGEGGVKGESKSNAFAPALRVRGGWVVGGWAGRPGGGLAF